MAINEAIKLLSKYNKWRRGDNRIKQPNPTELGIAIEVIIDYVRISQPIHKEFAKNNSFNICKNKIKKVYLPKLNN